MDYSTKGVLILMMDLITIIVPMYNAELHLAKTLQSLSNQTYQNIQVILINDASEDKTQEIAESFTDRYANFTLINQEANMGVSAARNVGLKFAKGKYVAFVDADDILPKNAIKSMYETAKVNQADLVVGLYKELLPDSTRIGPIFKRYKKLTNAGRIFPFSQPEIFSHTYLWGKLYKKQLINNISFPEGIHYAEDQPFSIFTYFNAERVFICPEIVYFYRKDHPEGSTTLTALKNPADYLDSVLGAYKYGQDLLDENGKSVDYKSLIFLGRILQSVKYLFEGGLIQGNQNVIRSMLEKIIHWIDTLPGHMILGTDNFQMIFFENGQEYMRVMDIENQKSYLGLLRKIKDKKLDAAHFYERDINIKNTLLDNFLCSIDAYIENNNVTQGEKNYSVCYPKVISYSQDAGEAKIEFKLIVAGKGLFKIADMGNRAGSWVICKLSSGKSSDTNLKLRVMTKKKPKVLLTYRDFSGCNTLALYKQAAFNDINKLFEITLYPGNKMSNQFVNMVVDSDIIVTTNMEYGFSKFGFNPNKLVIDLWHGFPLKNMFFKDPNYRNKNSISPYWEQFDYMLSYSDLYTELVSSCIGADPNKFFVSGAPRNDLLLNASRENLFRLLGLTDDGKKVIFYLPTFRLADQKGGENNSANLFGFCDFDFTTFDDFLGKNGFHLVIKGHPIFGRDFEPLVKHSNNITLLHSNDLMNYNLDLYEILGAADLLITDYSSVFFDFLLLNKPIIFIPTDLAEYIRERGFILNKYEDWTPGPKALNQYELQQAILKFEENARDYQKMRIDIRDKVHHYYDPYSSNRVWDFISSLVES